MGLETIEGSRPLPNMEFKRRPAIPAQLVQKIGQMFPFKHDQTLFVGLELDPPSGPRNPVRTSPETLRIPLRNFQDSRSCFFFYILVAVENWYIIARNGQFSIATLNYQRDPKGIYIY